MQEENNKGNTKSGLNSFSSPWLCDVVRLKVDLDDEVRGPEAETELSGHDLLRLFDSARQREHQGGLVDQLLLVVFVLQGPLQSLRCRQESTATFLQTVSPEENIYDTGIFPVLFLLHCGDTLPCVKLSHL